jgi:hypothetical protein
MQQAIMLVGVPGTLASLVLWFCNHVYLNNHSSLKTRFLWLKFLWLNLERIDSHNEVDEVVHF